MTTASIAGPGATLEWDANTEPDVTGYRLHYGTTSGNYTRNLDAGNTTTATVPELIAGFTYYFAVTAYNDTGLESPPSNEVSFTVPWPAALQVTYLPRAAVPFDSREALECAPVAGPIDGGFAFTVTAAEQTAVTVYASEDMNTWEVQGSVTNPTGRLIIRDLSSAGHKRRFYRLGAAFLDPVED